MKNPMIDLNKPTKAAIETKVRIEEPVLEKRFSLNHLLTPAN